MTPVHATTTAPIDPVDREIGGRIRTRREAARMTQPELAKHARVTFQQIQKYERGQNRVAAARLLQIAVALRTTGADLLGELEDGGPDGLALATPGATALLSAFRTIDNPDTRNAVLAIVMSLANAETPARYSVEAADAFGRSLTAAH